MLLRFYTKQQCLKNIYEMQTHKLKDLIKLKSDNQLIDHDHKHYYFTKTQERVFSSRQPVHRPGNMKIILTLSVTSAHLNCLAFQFKLFCQIDHLKLICNNFVSKKIVYLIIYLCNNVFFQV